MSNLSDPARAALRLRRWTDADTGLLEAANTPELTEHLVSPETLAQVARRHQRYVRGWDLGMPRMYAIMSGAQGLGSIGWWESAWGERPVYETGWVVLPAAQRQGVATAALRLLMADVRAAGDGRPLIACPSVSNVASNALCRGAGFELAETMTEEFRGEPMRLNVWVLESP